MQHFFVLNTFSLTPAYLLFQAISIHGFCNFRGNPSARTKLPRSTSKRPFLHHGWHIFNTTFWKLSCIWLWIMLQIKPLWKIICNQFLNNGKINTLIYSTFWNCLHLVMKNAPDKNYCNKYPNLDRHLVWTHQQGIFRGRFRHKKSFWFFWQNRPLKNFVKHEIESLRYEKVLLILHPPPHDSSARNAVWNQQGRRSTTRQQASRSPVCFWLGREVGSSCRLGF